MIVLKILGIIVFAAFALVACGALLLMIRLHKLYNKKKCKYCDHYMTYRGTREEKGKIFVFSIVNTVEHGRTFQKLK